jgi:hypothetical protein
MNQAAFDFEVVARSPAACGRTLELGPITSGYDEADAARLGSSESEPRGGSYVAGLDVLVPRGEGGAV